MRVALFGGLLLSLACASGSNLTSTSTGSHTHGATSGSGGTTTTGTGTSGAATTTTTSGGTPDAGCANTFPLHQCPPELIEVAGKARDVCQLGAPVRGTVQITDLNDLTLTANTDGCGDFFFCVDAGTVVTPQIQATGYLPTSFLPVQATSPTYLEMLVVCATFLDSLGITIDPGKSIVVVQVLTTQIPTPSGSSAACPTYFPTAAGYQPGTIAGWSPVLWVPDGGPTTDSPFYVQGLTLDPGATATGSRGLAVFANVDPTLGTLQLGAAFDGGGVCLNGAGAFPYELGQGFVPQPGAVTSFGFVASAGSLLAGRLGCQSTNSSAVVTTLAGTPLPGSLPGATHQTGAALASFAQLAFDPQGNLLLADRLNSAIRRMDLQGNFTTLVGNGLARLRGRQRWPERHRPAPRARGSPRTISATSSWPNTQPRHPRVSPSSGNLTTLAGNSVAAYVDGPASIAEFNFPLDVAVDSQGNLYVADTNNNAIRKIDPTGNVTTLAGQVNAGFVNGAGTAASFDQPSSLALDDAGNLLVADRGNHAIRKVDPSGNVTTFAGSGVPGMGDGQGTQAQFYAPVSIRLDAQGNAYVADTDVGEIPDPHAFGRGQHPPPDRHRPPGPRGRAPRQLGQPLPRGLRFAGPTPGGRRGGFLRHRLSGLRGRSRRRRDAGPLRSDQRRGHR